MNLPLSPEDFNNICRLCLVKRDIKPLFESNVVIIVSSITDIQIETGDRLPQSICLICANYLEDIIKFADKCRTNDAILKSCLEANDKSRYKEESDSDDEVLAKYLYNYNDNESDDDLDVDLKNDVKTDPDVNINDENHNSSGEEFMEKEKKRRKRGRKRKVSLNIQNNLRIPKRRGRKPKPKVIKEESCIPVCDSCGETFTSKAKLCQHYKENDSCRPHNFRLFKCEICEKEFSTLRRRNEHMNIHTGETPYICDYCGKGFQLYPAHFKHVYRHRVELGEVELKPGYTEKRVRLNLQCQLCPKVFASRSGFANHLLIHQGIKIQYKRRVKKESDPKLKNFLCNYCAKSFRTKVQLDGHIRGHTGERPFSCSMCEKVFKTRAALKTHEQVHLGTVPKRFECEICKKPFSLKAHYEVHRRTHTGEKPFECNFCGKCFNYRGTWRIHLRLHTGETPYACPICGNRYHDKSSLNKHQKNKGHHGEAVVQEKLIL